MICIHGHKYTAKPANYTVFSAKQAENIKKVKDALLLLFLL